MRVRLALASMALSVAVSSPFVFASDEPYLDAIRKTMPQGADDKTNSDGYTEHLKQGMKAPAREGAYLEEILRTAPPVTPESSSDHYTEKKKAELNPQPTDDQSAIAKVKEGHSELELKRPGKIHYAGGFRVSAAATRSYKATGDSKKRDFNDVYGTDWSPDFHLNFEFQPFHSEWFGNIGVFSEVGLAFFKGKGKFAVPLKKPAGVGGYYSNTAQTEFRFTQAPLTAGLNYRFNLARLFRPYVQAGPQIVVYSESRNDSHSGNKGYSTGMIMGGGMAILMDWVSRGSTWSYYEDFSVKHYYLIIDYTQTKHISGDIDFASSIASVGFLFEL